MAVEWPTTKFYVPINYYVFDTLDNSKADESDLTTLEGIVGARASPPTHLYLYPYHYI